jgi:activator of HSP90 ATPase
MTLNRHLPSRKKDIMDERGGTPAIEPLPTRRRMLAGIGAALGVVATVPAAMGVAQAPSMQEPPSNPADQARTSLHQEVAFKATPQRLCDLLLDSKLFAAFTGMPAEIDRKPGGTFKTFGGLIEGRNIEIVANQRIVQAWRPASWGPGVYSIVHFEFKPQGAITVIVLDHTGFPEGKYDRLDSGWPQRYWEPLRKYLSLS